MARTPPPSSAPFDPNRPTAAALSRAKRPRRVGAWATYLPSDKGHLIMTDAVFSRRQVQHVQGTRGIYTVAPLTIRERAAYRADMAGEGCRLPTRTELLVALRHALTELAPANLAEVQEVVQRAEAALEAGDQAEPLSAADQAALGVIEAAARQVPSYAALLKDQVRWFAMMPLITARHALRGWESESLPPFKRQRGIVPDELLEEVGEEDLSTIATAAMDLMFVSKPAEKN